MPLPTRGRSQYNPISATDAEEETGNTATVTDDGASTTSSASSSRRKRDNTLHQDQRISKEDTPLKTDDDEEDYENDQGERITVVILDSAQKKFPIPANPDWTVGVFKRISFKTHKVAPASQRLIFRGKMLDDKKTLRDVGLHTDDLIVHLFPKPRVVVTNRSSSNVTGADDSTDGGDSGSDGGGAHVPQIILDEEEQQRRGQILVLGSAEIAEAQNNVKLLSLLLLVVCAMRLMALFSIAMGVAEEPVHLDDDITPPSAGNHTAPSGGHSEQYQVRQWESEDYFDLLVSGIGFYVATLGMKATTENTLRLANAYMIGTIVAGISWNVWNAWMYLLFVKEETTPNDDDEIMPLTTDDFVTVAFFTVMLPLGVWWMCCVRAWQFRALIAEAELEAAERIQSQLRLTEGAEDEQGGDGPNEERELTQISSSSNPNSSITIV
mmetsp:Transcript_23140/g.35218  ORF Transcript_23140/g.35218 Transcript_23140/m.35218 type:complete len:439 (+) Transcript_23140:166-1482(+)